MNIDSDFVMTINGESVTTDATQPVYNPATRSVFAQVPDASQAQLDETVRTAKQAFKSWSKTPAEERQAALESDPELARQYQRDAELSRYGALVAWRSRSIGLTSVIATVDDMQIPNELTWLLQANVFALGQPSLTNENYRSYLAANLRSKQTQRYREAVIHSAIKLFNDMAVNNVAAKPLEQWVEDAKWLILSRAQHKIQQGQLVGGVQDGLICIDFAPGDSSVSESLFESLNAVQAARPIKTLLGGSSKFYRSMLAEFPNSPLHRNNFAWVRICARQDLELARRHIEVALSRRPNNPSYLDTMAELEFLSGNVQAALRLNQRCIQNNPFRRFYRLQRQKFLQADSQ